MGLCYPLGMLAALTFGVCLLSHPLPHLTASLCDGLATGCL